MRSWLAMLKDSVIADSSFYVFFLSDIERPAYLLMIAKSCTLLAPDLVISELGKHHDSEILSRIVDATDLYRYGIIQALTPFIERDQAVKGEHEVIALAHVMRSRNLPFTLVLDDRAANRFARRNFPDLRDATTGTMGFVVKCYTRRAIFTQAQALEILGSMKSSGFRVPNDLVDSAIREVRGQ